MQRSAFLLCALCAIAIAAVHSSAAPSPAGKQPADAAPPASNFYTLLGTTPSDTASDPAILKRAYRKLALAHHPDKATSDEDKAAKQAFFVRLSQAYEILSDPRTKTRYDYLLSQGQTEYDYSRDWGDFDVSQGFKRQPKSAAERAAAADRKAAEAKWKEAQETFRRAAEEAEEFALWTAMSIAFGIALLPAVWMVYSRRVQSVAEVTKRKERSSELKATQAALAELQAEQERERREAQAAEREYARELRREREEAAAAAAAAASSSSVAATGGSGEEGSWEVVDGSEKVDDSAAEEDASSEDDADAKVVLKCVPCKKSFKSQQQLDNHEASAKHQKALKDSKKKSRREE